MPEQEARLDQVLHAVFMIEYCLYHERKKAGTKDVGSMIGIMDWVTELHRLLQGGAIAE